MMTALILIRNFLFECGMYNRCSGNKNFLSPDDEAEFLNNHRQLRICAVCEAAVVAVWTIASYVQ